MPGAGTVVRSLEHDYYFRHVPDAPTADASVRPVVNTSQLFYNHGDHLVDGSGLAGDFNTTASSTLATDIPLFRKKESENAGGNIIRGGQTRSRFGPRLGGGSGSVAVPEPNSGYTF